MVFLNEMLKVLAHIHLQHSSILITDENTVISTTNSDTAHPLTATETDVYDNANSLQVIHFQTHYFKR